MFLVTSPIVINVPTRGLLAVETMHAIVRWLVNLNIKRNMTSMFVNKKHRYYKEKFDDGHPTPLLTRGAHLGISDFKSDNSVRIHTRIKAHFRKGELKSTVELVITILLEQKKNISSVSKER